MINVWTRPKDGASVETAKLNYADGVAVGDGEWRRTDGERDNCGFAI